MSDLYGAELFALFDLGKMVFSLKENKNKKADFRVRAYVCK